MHLFGFCGIAGPESFKTTLETGGLNLTGFKAYEDHHAYTPENIRALLHKAKISGADGLVTTEKDLVKLRHIMPQEFPLLVQPVQLILAEEFDRFLHCRLDYSGNH